MSQYQFFSTLLSGLNATPQNISDDTTRQALQQLTTAVQVLADQVQRNINVLRTSGSYVQVNERYGTVVVNGATTLDFDLIPTSALLQFTVVNVGTSDVVAEYLTQQVTIAAGTSAILLLADGKLRKVS